jgi:phosphatidylinositol alpha-1,6-mannosyltransferase
LVHMVPALIAGGRLPALGVELVHSLEMFPCGWIGDRLAAREKVPHILTAYGTYGVVWHRWRLAARLYAGVLRRAACVCPMSQGTAERLSARFGGALEKTPVEIVHHGSTFADRVPRRVAEKKEFPPDPFVLSVGSIKPRKGYHDTLRAFAKLQHTYPDARYVIAGGGLDTDYHRRLQAILAEERIRNVEFAGPLSWEALDPLYRKASMLVMTSQEEDDHFEGFVFVFLEAGAYGLPVIGTRTGGIPDAVVDGETGILCPPHDTDAVLRAMVRLSTDRALAKRLGGNGRVRAEELTWERYAERQYAVYRRILRSARGEKAGYAAKEKKSG